MAQQISPLQKLRAEYKPKLPKVLAGNAICVKPGERLGVAEAKDEIGQLFPCSCDKPILRIEGGKGDLSTAAVTVGVVLSGGQAPGGHNVIAGLFDALKAANPENRLVGFLGGPKGVITGKFKEIADELMTEYRNTGGFDMIGSGRDKIESAEDLASCEEQMKKNGVSALVVIGGDDSNTNAAIMAEHFLAKNAGIQVIGVPKTIDGDMKGEVIETSFGFDTAAKTYAELVGNICRDSMSAKKYWHFVKLMGRSASHVALEVALQTQANLTLISEEVQAKKMTLAQVVDQVVDVVARRAKVGKNYGVVVIPEGLLEFLVDFKDVLLEIGNVLRTDDEIMSKMSTDYDRVLHMIDQLPADQAAVYRTLPSGIQAVLLRRDKHGNIPVSQVDTEKLLMDMVSDRLAAMKKAEQYKGSFAALIHFFGYEGRCVPPSNFDADYTYVLGFTAAQLIRAGATGYTVFAADLVKPASDWKVGGVPVTSMLCMEMRKGKKKPVIRKALVELEGGPFKAFAAQRDSWVEDDAFLFPGPIQYWGPAEVSDALTKTLQLERSK